MIKVDYDFYNEYVEDSYFNDIFQNRVCKVQNDINNQYIKTNNIIEDYFVEIFSWTVLPKSLLYEINTLIEGYILDYTVIDPCSGNSFHTFLFHHFCNKRVITTDIQIEEQAWIETLECDGLSYMKNCIRDYKDKVLLLAWIDYDDLTVGLLREYKGDIVIGIGNYDETNAKQYLTELKNHYTLIKHYELLMPWNSLEHIRIYKKYI